ncbi:MAG TPA: M1 family metallopeptidase [Candidatus Polarisedimenticolia bacterium]|nr:M1 family metallopeptidase [Candidatus Polarisedimenticolia bacterium]
MVRTRSRLVPQRLLALLLLAAAPAAAPATAAQADNARLGAAVAPTFQAVRLEMDPSADTYTGLAEIDLQVKEAAASFRFHALEMDLRRVTLAAVNARPGGGIDLSHEPGPLGLVTATAPAPIAPGAYRLRIEFSNDFGKRATGLYKALHAGDAYAFTQFQAEDARAAFPCWDEPGFKIPWKLTLVVPAAHLAVTNTPVEKETVQGDRRTVVFAKTKPLPSYLVALASGPFESVPIAGMSAPGRVITVKGRSKLAAAAAAGTPKLLAASERWFAGRYPFEKLDILAIPEYWPGAMENPGLITFSENILLIDPAASTPARLARMAGVNAHELAHMWFGDLVTMSWWDDLWLNESFADWMGDKIAAQVHPELEIPLNEMQSIDAVKVSDARPSAQAIRRPVAAADNKLEGVGTAYNKGKAVLAMFERWIGPEAFRKGVLDYLKAHAWGSATSDDLWKALARASGQDVSAAMAGFLEQPGLPLVRAERLGGGRVRLTQRRFLADGAEAPALAWRVPVTLAYGAAGRRRTATVLLAGPEQTVSLEAEPEWILPDGGAGGYYRWSLPAEDLAALAGRAGGVLDPRERIGFVGNLSALLDAGEVHGDLYLRTLESFARDPQAQVVAAVVAALAKVRTAFVPDDLADPFAVYVRRVLGPALEKAGMEPATGEPASWTSLRPQLIEWLGGEGKDEQVAGRARAMGRAYLADPASVHPSLAGVALNLLARQGDRQLHAEMRSRFESAGTPEERSRFLAALGEFTEQKLVEENLSYALSGPLRPQELFSLASGLADTEQGRDRLYRFVTENYAAITGKLPAQFAGFIPGFAGGGCEPRRIEKAREFFSRPEHIAPGTETSLARAADQVEECARLRRREGASVGAYLRSGAAVTGASR